ncbi:23S rRNA methyltransferase [Candidatus Rickettsiella isopodorum]|jgi:23S rRNA (uridine2552-2'-O)-methyltransferase|uniref:Ribosomal RNA large subunit methyltransferase E n=1 Tax=Candidatus Rickettsiella isopodorum TaxID=1225476 RepID=A0A1J8PGQ8_9COXI|nr:23S rRNA (uridine(2552)-2'-O)-methyltransferase RlmE [Candidatus Rickettsiella isopodorum]OIZ94253.1 23S rRNA methyltransferase [Candidatus Rickettsiella isopodorum]
MSKSKSSHRWLKQHFNDPYVKRAQKEGLRSRSAYKLLEIQEKTKLIKSGMNIVDLGASPGGWSQLASGIVGTTGKVYALDILPMETLSHVEFLKGDFREESIMQQFLQRVQSKPIDLVISDMAPNFSGMRSVDQPRSMYLAELALDFAQKVLKPKGCLIVKTFQGEGFEAFLKDLRSLFAKVTIRKPSASRGSSAEVYLVAVGYHKGK